MANKTVRDFRLMAVVAGMALTCGLVWAQEKGSGLLKPGDKIPGAFQALAVTLPPTTMKPIPQAGRFHCPEQLFHSFIQSSLHLLWKAQVSDRELYLDLPPQQHVELPADDGGKQR